MFFSIYFNGKIGRRNMQIKGVIAANAFASLLTISPAYAAGASSPAWGGYYAGFTAGASHGTASPTVGTRNTGYFITTDPLQINPQASTGLSKTNLSGNLFYGFNRQTGNTVYGLEADISLDNFNEQYSSGNITYLTAPPSTFSVTTKVKSDWSISLRPRIGYASENSLLYVSAGPSIRRFKYDFLFTDSFTPEYVHVNQSKWTLGWIAGLGYDYKMPNDWSLRTEYLYSSCRNIVNTQSNLRATPTDGFTHNLNFQAYSLRVGLVKMFKMF